VPRALVDQLASDGRLVIPADGGDERLTLVRRHDGETSHEPLEPVRFVPLVRDEPSSAEEKVARSIGELVE